MSKTCCIAEDYWSWWTVIVTTVNWEQIADEPASVVSRERLESVLWPARQCRHRRCTPVWTSTITPANTTTLCSVSMLFSIHSAQLITHSLGFLLLQHYTLILANSTAILDTSVWVRADPSGQAVRQPATMLHIPVLLSVDRFTAVFHSNFFCF